MKAATGGRSSMLVVMLASVAGCAGLHANTTADAARAWPSVLMSAQNRATEGKFELADSVLADYATRNPGTSQALETAYWRALFRLDPTNQHASLPNAMAALDGYMADPRLRQHVVETMTIRRVAAQLDGLNRLAANAMAQAKDATVIAKDAKAQAIDARDAAAKAADTPPTADAEIKRLKDELSKANAELDRIRKRLAQPPPKLP